MTEYGPTPEQNTKYFLRREKARQQFEEYGTEYANGTISHEEYKKKMHDAILEFLIDLAILAEGSTDFTDADITDLTSYVADILELSDQMIDFVSDRANFSDDYLTWRAGIFSNARQVFMRFTMPRDVWSVLPELPGDNCLGDGACGCSWIIDQAENGTITAYWVLGATEHCAVCKANRDEYNPFISYPGD